MNNNKIYINQEFNPTSYIPCDGYEIKGKEKYIDYSYLELFEKKINSKLDHILKEIEEMKEIKVKIDAIHFLFLNFGKIINNVNSIIKNIKSLSEPIYNNSEKIKKSINDKEQKNEKRLIKNEKIFIDGRKIYLKEKKISDFIVSKKKK